MKCAKERDLFIYKERERARERDYVQPSRREYLLLSLVHERERERETWRERGTQSVCVC